MQLPLIQSKIHEIRSQKVMLDFDLAELYEVETKNLNLAVKRNTKRFPVDFMFQLTKSQWERLRLQIETSKGRGGTRYLPYAFTEQGVAMLSGVLSSKKAVEMNIEIMRAFVEIRRIVLNKNDVKKKLQDITKRIGEHDLLITELYEAIENIIDENAAQKKWDGRKRIGYRDDS